MNQVAPVPPKEPMISPGLLWTFIIVVVAAAGYFGWNYYSQSKTKTETPVAVVTTPTTTPKATDPTANWTSYANTKYGYSLKYPAGWYVYGYKTGDEAVAPTLNIALKDSQAQSHYITVSTGNSTEMEAIITAAAKKTNYQTTMGVAGGQTGPQYTWTEVLDGKNVADIKLVKVTQGDYTYYLYGIVTDYNKTATIDQGNFAEILATFKFTSASTTPVTSQ